MIFRTFEALGCVFSMAISLLIKSFPDQNDQKDIDGLKILSFDCFYMWIHYLLLIVLISLNTLIFLLLFSISFTINYFNFLL